MQRCHPGINQTAKRSVTRMSTRPQNEKGNELDPNTQLEKLPSGTACRSGPILQAANNGYEPVVANTASAENCTDWAESRLSLRVRSSTSQFRKAAVHPSNLRSGMRLTAVGRTSHLTRPKRLLPVGSVLFSQRVVLHQRFWPRITRGTVDQHLQQTSPLA